MFGCKKNSRNVITDDECLRNNDTALVSFEFKNKPQFLKIGTRFILAEGKTKVVGEVVSIE
jgi:GTPase